MAATKTKKNKISFLFPAPLGQICFFPVLISPNHKAQNRYPEMVMARTDFVHMRLHERTLNKISTTSHGAERDSSVACFLVRLPQMFCSS